MERKEWLETFMKLVNTGAPTLGYRRELRLFPKQVKVHLAKLPQYREELKKLRSEEAKKNEMRERMAKARALKEKRRLEALERKAKEDARRQSNVDSESGSTGEDDS